jgi:hypothetical protein
VTVLEKVAPANLVPAAAVIRGGQALFGQTGRKASLGGLACVCGESPRRNLGVSAKTAFLEFRRGGRYSFKRVKML